jgi:PEP-CTERM motif-containing protein
MKPGRAVLLVGFVLLFGSASLAQTPIDPVIGVGGGSGSISFTGQVIFVISPENGATCTGGEISVCSFTSAVFQNNTGQNITNFDFMFNQSQPGPFSVAEGSLFPTLTVISDFNTANPSAILSGGTIFPFEIVDPSPTEFTLSMGGVFQGTRVDIVSNVPEPGTLTLLLTGIGAFALRRKSRAKTQS